MFSFDTINISKYLLVIEKNHPLPGSISVGLRLLTMKTCMFHEAALKNVGSLAPFLGALEPLRFLWSGSVS
jgi:hypothetical protein